MLFIGDLANRDLSERLAEKLGTPQPIYIDKHIFPDGEMRVRILEEVAGQEVVVLKSHVNPTDSSVLENAFVIDALKRNGAGHITAVIPYIGYMRGDHLFRTGEAVPLEVIILLLENAGLSKIAIVDPHSIRIPEMFHVPVSNLTALEVFADKIREMELRAGSYTLVTPDMGGLRRIKILSELLDNVPFVTIEKNRDLETGNVVTAKIEGEVGETCFIVDDMISSGGTIIKAIRALKKLGAKHIFVMATHGVLSENAPSLLQTSFAEKIFLTDSIPISSEKRFEKLEILSIADLIAKSLL